MEEKTSNRAVVALLCCDHLMKNRIMVVISCSISIRLLVVVVHISFSSSEEADQSLLFLLLFVVVIFTAIHLLLSFFLGEIYKRN